MFAARHIVPFCAALVLPFAAWAQQQSHSAVLVVTRTEAAKDCPDAESLTERVAKINGEALLGTSRGVETRLAFHVHIDANQAGYAATIRAEGARSGVRRIADIGSDCTGLAEALSVTLAIILDDERVAPAAPPGKPPPPVAPPAKPPPARAILGGRAHLGVGITLGVLESAALAAVVGAGIDAGWGLLVLDAFWLPSRDFSLAPGDVDVSLLAASLSGCWRALGSIETVWLAPCAHVSAGVLQGSGDGYSRDRSAERPWIAPGLGLRAGGVLSGPLEWYADARLFAPVHRERFVVDNLGTAHETPPLGAMLAAGGALAFW